MLYRQKYINYEGDKMNSLMLGSTHERVNDREVLKRIETPEGTKSWKPISQYDIATKVVNEAIKRDYNVVKEEYGFNPTGLDIFGLVHLNQPDSEKTRLIAFRNSNSKQFAFSICAGFQITICSNMMMGSDIGDNLQRRHTKNIEQDLDHIIKVTFDQLPNEFTKLEEHIQRMKSTKMDINKARIIIMQSIEQRMIRPSDGLQVIKEFKHSRHKEFSGRNSWSLYNGYTQVMKKYSPAKADRTLRGLSKLFELK